MSDLPGQRAAEPPRATRDLIAQHAAELFEEQGYAATSIRAIARAAGVDPALVMRHFGSKEELFVHVLGFEKYFGPKLDGPAETLGASLVDYVLSPDHGHMRRTFLALVRASDRASVRVGLQKAIRSSFVDQLAPRLAGRDAELRANLISAQLGGLIQSWSMSDLDHLPDGHRRRIVEHYGRAVQQLLDAPPD
ncbi:TetR/AcrR family transcriptional regulator [Rhodococcus sp. X156]|uniref:TetR/AcrR family transcriptional regulator n=1 Tax=Rhodococcus sp. X156 TaxID=2499145 RepID=UPI000FD75EEB|nr:TetR/AcrR family transcriptional regulator [Rhodococcus sp. X156]